MLLLYMANFLSYSRIRLFSATWCVHITGTRLSYSNGGGHSRGWVVRRSNLNKDSIFAARAALCSDDFFLRPCRRAFGTRSSSFDAHFFQPRGGDLHICEGTSISCDNACPAQFS